MSTLRINKVNELIKATVSEIISREVEFPPGVFITITKVDTSADLRYARVFVSVFPEKRFGSVLDLLEKKMYMLQGKINKRLSMKPLPKIEIVSDHTESKADKIEKILKEL